MYAFGDDLEPIEESKDYVEQVAIGFIESLLRKSMERSSTRGFHNKISKDDLLFVLQDNKKYTRRIAEILIKSQNVKNIKQQLEDKI
jgi:hypothetical protein